MGRFRASRQNRKNWRKSDERLLSPGNAAPDPASAPVASALQVDTGGTTPAVTAMTAPVAIAPENDVFTTDTSVPTVNVGGKDVPISGKQLDNYNSYIAELDAYSKKGAAPTVPAGEAIAAAGNGGFSTGPIRIDPSVTAISPDTAMTDIVNGNPVSQQVTDIAGRIGVPLGGVGIPALPEEGVPLAEEGSDQAIFLDYKKKVGRDTLDPVLDAEFIDNAQKQSKAINAPFDLTTGFSRDNFRLGRDAPGRPTEPMGVAATQALLNERFGVSKVSELSPEPEPASVAIAPAEELEVIDDRSGRRGGSTAYERQEANKDRRKIDIAAALADQMGLPEPTTYREAVAVHIKHENQQIQGLEKLRDGVAGEIEGILQEAELGAFESLSGSLTPKFQENLVDYMDKNGSTIQEAILAYGSDGVYGEEAQALLSQIDGVVETTLSDDSTPLGAKYAAKQNRYGEIEKAGAELGSKLRFGTWKDANGLAVETAQTPFLPNPASTVDALFAGEEEKLAPYVEPKQPRTAYPIYPTPGMAGFTSF